MGVTKTVLKEGTGEIPKKGDRVTIEYTGYLKDPSKPGNKGDQYVHILLEPPVEYADADDACLDSTPPSAEVPSSLKLALAQSSGVCFPSATKRWSEGSFVNA
jgi:hypothetical protein